MGLRTETSAGKGWAGRSFGVYVHWPYCAAKCPYCDFNSHASRLSAGREERYLSACLKDLDHLAALAPAREVESIFFGGGTPSLMSESAVGAVIERIADLWRVRPDAEITLEANPSSSEAQRFAGYRAAGVNRLSLGVQSLNDNDLRFLGRLHDAAQARAALDAAHRHFPRVSFDMIYGRPRQTAAAWRTELLEALRLASGHLSLYQLTIEPGTAFHARRQAGRLATLDSEAAISLFELTQELCENAGLPAYEVSNHAAPGQECRHNLVYWRYGEYAGAGPGAHGRLIVGDRRLALAALRDPEAWKRQAESLGHGIETQEALSPLEEAEERLIMGLRLREGVDLAAMEAETGFCVAPSALAALESDGLLERFDDGRMARGSVRGRLVLNALILTMAESLVPGGTARGRGMRRKPADS